MRLALRWFFLFLVGCSGVYGHEEYFNENLKISSLQDGRVSTTFSFETILKGVPPRDPRLLNAPDSCMSSIYRAGQRGLTLNSSTLYRIPSGSWTNPQRIRGDGVAPHTQCWELELRTLGIS